MRFRSFLLSRAVSGLLPLLQLVAHGQATPPVRWTAEQDHANMMQQLGIYELRPGPSGDEHAPNYANYDESRANPFPVYPDALTMANGEKVTSAEQWWTRRRPELVEDLEREMYGRVPKAVPRVTWKVMYSETEFFAGRLVTARQLVGHVDNAAYPALSVDIRMTEVLPAGAAQKVPVLIMFGRTGVPAPVAPPLEDQEKVNAALRSLLAERDPSLAGVFAKYPAYQPSPTPPTPRFGPPPNGTQLTPQELLIQAGWGYATLDPASIQADNGEGLTAGIVGLVNHGQPRKPDDWGALRAWSWGAGQAFDYLAADPAVDQHKVGIEGVSRFGKAALVTLAFDPRFAIGLIGSSGEGGAKPSRRNFGEAAESLGGGEYYWMAGNFIKYSAAKSTTGPHTPNDLPVDSNSLIALCAPRLTFISYGNPAHGDPNWLDQRGSLMAAVAAQPVFRLLGARGLGLSDDYTRVVLPPIETGLLDGQLAWRQHDGGHTDAPNFPVFLTWADRSFRVPSVLRLDPELDRLIAPGTIVEKIASGFRFTEGPMWRVSEGRLWFVDVVGDTVNAVTPDGKVEVLVRKAGGFPNKPPESYNGPNAMVPAPDGTVIMAQQGGRKIVRITAQHTLMPFLDGYEGHSFNSPNDLVFAHDGSLWFTDPPYGLKQGDADPAKQLPYNAVFRLDHGQLSPVIQDLTLPNGLAFSPDGGVLYVANSGPRQRVMQYRVDAGGKVSDARVLIEYPHPEGAGIPDGLKVDSKGNIWTTGPGGIRVISPAGKVLGQIKLPETATNLAWGGDGFRDLYITAQSSIYRVHTQIAGEKPKYTEVTAP